VTRLEKLDAGIFVVLWIGLMLLSGDEAWAYVAWENIFMHCLGTVVMTAVTAAFITLIFFGIYYLFREGFPGWGRLLVIPWLILARFLYRPILESQDWPKTNSNPPRTAAFFALVAAPVILAAVVAILALVADVFRER
jgi:hypothetical protein